MPIGSNGQDFIVNTTTQDDQFEPTVAVMADGRFVVTWSSSDNGDGSNTCVRARIFSSDGSPMTSDFRLNSTTEGNQYFQTVSVLADGRFFVAWQSEDFEDGSSYKLRGSLFGSDGSALGDDFVIETSVDHLPTEVASTALANGRFMVTWHSQDDGDGDDSSIRARLFDANGMPAVPDFILNSTGTSQQSSPSITQLSNGRILATWSSADTGDGLAGCLRARLFNSDATPLGPDFVVNTRIEGSPRSPEVTELAGGGFFIVWLGENNASVRGRVYGADGLPLFDDFQINTIAGASLQRPGIALLADGGVVVTWASDLDGDGSAIGARLFDPTGVPRTPTEFVVNTTVSGNQFSPNVATMDDGRFVVTWQSADTGDGSLGNVRARIFDPTIFNGTGAIDRYLGGDLDDRMYGGAGGDTLGGGGGDDVISGDGGDDTLNGGLGNDRLFGGTGDDQLSGGGGDDVMIGAAGNDQYVVENAGDIVDESTGTGTDTIRSLISISLVPSATLRGDVENIRLLNFEIDDIPTSEPNPINATGNALANRIQGNDSDNIIDGGAGADEMIGRGGSDTYVVDDAGDTISELAGSGMDAVRSSISFSLVEGVIVKGRVENLTLTGATAVSATGSEFANVLVGNSISNILDGLGGADTMRGGAGSDLYRVNEAGDVVDESVAGSNGVDTVQTTISFSLTNNLNVLGIVENVSLLGNANINAIGSALANTLYGNSGANLLDGLGGADVMRGRGGSDLYRVDNAGDVVDEADAGGGGTDTVQTTLSFSLTNNPNVLGVVENVSLLGSGNINVTGNALANILWGNIGTNILDGLTGADTMRGRGGSDLYRVDNVGDIVDEADAGGGGIDVVQSSITFSLVNSARVLGAVEILSLTGTSAINGTGNALANSLFGNSASNVLTGGAGQDAFVFHTALNAASNVDTITDFSVADDTIRLENAVFTALTTLGTLASGAFFAGAAAHDADDRIIYNPTTGALSYDFNGNLAGGGVKFAQLSTGLALSSADFFVI